MDGIDLRYLIKPLASPKFTKSELRRIGLVFLKDLEDLEEAFSELGVKYDKRAPMHKTGLALSNFGTLKKPKWVLYEEDLDYTYVLDIMNKSNFYEIYQMDSNEETKRIFAKARLRPHMIDDDLEYYISTHVNMISPHSYSNDYLN